MISTPLGRPTLSFLQWKLLVEKLERDVFSTGSGPRPRSSPGMETFPQEPLKASLLLART